jgi:trk system potassium uptake protein TrkA
MYIVIIGGGEVGYYLAKALLGEGHETVIVEKEASRIEFITNELGSIGYRGDGCEVATLAEVGTNRADMLIAVTPHDEDNLVACQLAKHKFNVPRTIARIRNPKNERLFKKLGVDVTVSSTNIILEHIEEEVPTHPITHLLSISDKGAEIVYIKIPPNSVTIGKKVRELKLPKRSILGLIIGKKLPRLPKGDTVIEEGDHIIAACATSVEQELIEALTGLPQTPASTP